MKTTQYKIGSSIENSQATITTNLGAKRTALKMVPSTFEPPEQSSPTLPDSKSRLSVMLNRTKASKDLQLQSDIQSQYSSGSFNPNIQFITSLLANKELICFDQGDCIPITDNHDRWVIISGEVKITGVNESSFTVKQGFVFFASLETKRKVKEIVALSPTSAFRIPQQIFKSSIRNYLYIKNSEKIKFLQFCPFIQWPQSLSEDIALTIEPFELMEKEMMIYNEGDQAKYLYFVKEGIVLLQRTGKIGNQIILDFEKHYESSYLGDDEGLVIVRKGMVFGVDGILIKEISRQADIQSSEIKDPHNLTNTHKEKDEDIIAIKNQSIQNSDIHSIENFVNGHIEKMDNEKQQEPKSIVRLKTTRIYNAKSIGKCELYKIDKNVLETYLKSQDKSPGENQVRFSNKQLDRICLEYTNLLMGSNHAVKELKKKNFELNVKLNETEMQFKKKKVEEIKMQEKKLRKITLNPQHKKHDHNVSKQPESPFPSMIRSPRKSLKQLSKISRDISLPSLKNKKYVQNLIFKKLQAQKMQKQAQKYMSYKKKIENSLLAKELKDGADIHSLQQQNRNGSNKVQNSQFISVRSYRSLLTPFHG